MAYSILLFLIFNSILYYFFNIRRSLILFILQLVLLMAIGIYYICNDIFIAICVKDLIIPKLNTIVNGFSEDKSSLTRSVIEIYYNTTLFQLDYPILYKQLINYTSIDSQIIDCELLVNLEGKSVFYFQFLKDQDLPTQSSLFVTIIFKILGIINFLVGTKIYLVFDK
jgi:hypothetical protein